MASRNILFSLVAGDQEALRFEWENQDLTLFTSITLRVRLEDESLFTIPATIIEPGPTPAGITDFEFGADQRPAGLHHCEVQTVDTVGRIDTLPDDNPIHLMVRERV